MALLLDSSSTNGSSGSGTSTTWSHTCTGSQLILWVYVSVYRGAGTPDQISGVTYNGVSMTQCKKLTYSSTGEEYLYYLVNPSTGTNNIVASFSASMDEIHARGASFTGAIQTGIPDSSATSGPTTSQTSLTVTTTTVANNCFLIGGFNNGNNGSWTAGTNSTIMNQESGRAWCYTNSAQTPAGSHSLNNTTPSSTVTGIMVSFAPFTGTTYTATLGYATYSLTGQGTILNRAIHAVLGYGSYVLTGESITVAKIKSYVANLGTGFYSLMGKNIDISAPLHSIWKLYSVASTSWKANTDPTTTTTWKSKQTGQ